MRRWIVLVILVVMCKGIFAQTSAWQLRSDIGINRIGWRWDVNAGLIKGKHLMFAGLRFYGANNVFETFTPGLNLGYTFQWLHQAPFSLNVGGQLALHYESKKEISAFLIEPKLSIVPQFKLSDNWDIYLPLSVGNVWHFVGGDLEIGQNQFTFVNYEMAVGVAYTF